MEIPILCIDRFLAVCIKPAGVLSEEGGMPEMLSAQCGGRFFCVHRLDKAVGGVMVYARDGKTAAKLSEMFAAKDGVTKEYRAVVQGVPAPPEGTLRDLLFHDAAKNKTFVVDRMRRGVKEAVLDYTLLAAAEAEDAGPLSLLSVTLRTGRSHQIRVQFGSRKLPLAGDGRYGSAVKASGIALQSHRLAFLHPVTGRPLEYTAPAPEGFPWSLFPETL